MVCVDWAGPTGRAADNFLPDCTTLATAEIPAAWHELCRRLDGTRSVGEVWRENPPEEGELKALLAWLRRLSAAERIPARFREVLTFDALLQQLRTLGIQTGDRLVVHSSLAAIGEVAGGAVTVAKALMAAVGEEGMLLMPSFNFHDVPAAREGRIDTYDPMRTPSVVGAISDAFWRLPGVHRSLAASHPVAGWGRGVENLLENHHRTALFGADSPLGLLEKAGGKALLIQCPRSNSFYHVVEMTNHAPCLNPEAQQLPVLFPDGTVRNVPTWIWRNGHCPITGDAGYFAAMEAAGTLRHGRLGHAATLFFRLADCRAALEPLLRGEGGCRNCAIRY